MKCPNPDCPSDASQVKDSRPAENSSAIRRRRVCRACGTRFTTYERVQLRVMMVKKKSGQRVPFDRDKLAMSIIVAMRKRPFSKEDLERIVAKVQRRLEERAESEIRTSVIGDMVLEELEQLDQVAFVRFASVYRNFEDVRDFARSIEGIGN